ncbi:helix-turn-helix transcriptional regulator [Streptomyces sp. LUP47B]|uniref:helix-turn-helix transcriptional regulator n=1 Tax=Streptomyces sp. LUP47B TaxID=1890286 RepID=UPI00085183E9
MLGHAAFVSGDPRRAQEAIIAAGGGRELPLLQPSIRPGQLDTLTGAALTAGDVDQAGRWAAQASREADRLGLDGQRAGALRAQASLAEHRGDIDKAVRLLEAAAEEYVRCGQSLWEAYTLLRAAPLVQRKGQGTRAAAMWHRAHRIAVGVGARLFVDLAELTRPQVMSDAPALPAELAELTAREVEVAGQLAEGLSNQDIAARLHLSRRTVETHLSSVYRKLSARSRSADPPHHPRRAGSWLVSGPLRRVPTRSAVEGRGAGFHCGRWQRQQILMSEGPRERNGRRCWSGTSKWGPGRPLRFQPTFPVGRHP